MIQVRSILDLAKIGPLATLPPTVKKDEVIIQFLKLGLNELYNRFNLSTKIETITTNPDLSLYELRSKDVSMILGLYNTFGQELTQTDTINGRSDYKLINYRSFLLNKPKDEIVFVVYKASPANIDIDSELDMPDAMFSALVYHIGFMAHSTINTDNANEADLYSKRFDNACTELEMQGYRISLSTECLGLQAKGYV